MGKKEIKKEPKCRRKEVDRPTAAACSTRRNKKLNDVHKKLHELLFLYSTPKKIRDQLFLNYLKSFRKFPSTNRRRSSDRSTTTSTD
jgi:hypothetical protein